MLKTTYTVERRLGVRCEGFPEMVERSGWTKAWLKAQVVL